METLLEHGLTARIITSHDNIITQKHQDIECNFVDGGQITYLIGTQIVTLEAGRWCIFWAAVPHLIIHIDPDVKLFRLTIPLSRFLQWDMPTHIVNPIMKGQMILDARGDLKLDKAMFKRWCYDLDLDADGREDIVLLELEARIQRLALYATIAQPNRIYITPQTQDYPFFKAKRMAEYIAQYYQTQSISAHKIAESVDLNPNYAMVLFKRYFKVSIGEYITQYRVAYAQQLLVSTDLSLETVAVRAGFVSMSRFYAVFKDACHHTPKVYRSLFSIL